MNSNLKTKFPSRNSGNIALACSLFLHAGFIVLFSTWQWEWKTTPKNQTKVVKIKFLPPPTDQRAAQTPATEKAKTFSPAQPITVSAHSSPTLVARTPRKLTPSQQPKSWVKRTNPSPTKHITPRRIHQASVLVTGTKPQAVRPLKTIQQRNDVSQKIEVRSSSTHKFYQTLSNQAAAPVKARSTGQPQVVQRRSPIQQATFQIAPVRVTQIASFKEASSSVLKNIQQRPVPTSATTDNSLTASQAVEPFKTYNESRPQVAALPRELTQSPSAGHDTSDTDLSNLRGLFTDRVRQRIANFKSYPRIAKRRGMEGQPIIAFTLDRLGQLTKTDLAQSSGYRLLDQAALEAVHQAAPYPEIPVELKTETYRFKLPISFKLK
jgi:protein TonB